MRKKEKESQPRNLGYGQNKQTNKHNKVNIKIKNKTKRKQINKHTKRGIESIENVYHSEI